MMKKKLLNYLQLGILLFGISFFLANCERENENNFQQKVNPIITVTIVDISEIETNLKIASKLRKIQKSVNKSGNFRDTIVNTQYGFTIDTDFVKYVENGNYNSYNFKISREEPEDDKLENLFITLNQDNQYDTFIVKYGFTYQEFLTLSQEELNTRITTFFPIDFDTSFLTRNSYRDYIECDTDWVWEPCSLPGPHGDGSTCNGDYVSVTTCTGGGGFGPGPGPTEPTDTTGGNQNGGGTGTSTNTGIPPSPPITAPTCPDCPELQDYTMNVIK